MRIARGISVTNTSKPISTAIVYDADAVAFFTAASITDTNQKSAVNQLVLDLKSANIWTKMKALYPVVGGVASSHAVNLKTPGTYNLSFATGWTHSSTGMTPNGATYADTNLTPSTNFNTTSFNHLTYYSRTNNAVSGEYVMGSLIGEVGNLGLTVRDSSNFTTFYSDFSTTIIYRSAYSNTTTDSRGLFAGSQQGSNIKTYKNGGILASNTTLKSAGLTLPTVAIYLGATNLNNVASNFTNKECAFASIGDGLTDAEASSFYSAVQTYQTTLGRQV